MSTTRHLTLAWSATREIAPVLKIAFASNDRCSVNQHFGAAEGFVIYGLEAGRADLLSVAEFAVSDMDGNEDKLATKIEALAGCAAVYCQAIGGSAVRQLMARGIQPVRLDSAESIEGILRQLDQAMGDGSIPWLTKALRRNDLAPATDAGRFDRMAEEGWQE